MEQWESIGEYGRLQGSMGEYISTALGPDEANKSVPRSTEAYGWPPRLQCTLHTFFKAKWPIWRLQKYSMGRYGALAFQLDDEAIKTVSCHTVS